MPLAGPAPRKIDRMLLEIDQSDVLRSFPSFADPPNQGAAAPESKSVTSEVELKSVLNVGVLNPAAAATAGAFPTTMTPVVLAVATAENGPAPAVFEANARKL